MADQFNKTFTWDLKVKQMGLTSKDLANLIVTEMQLPITAEQYINQVGAIHLQLFPTASLMPGKQKKN